MPTTTRPPDDRLLTEEDLAEMLRVTPRTVRRWRQKRTGPRVVRVMGAPRYWRSDVVAWVDREPEE
jgi:predicted DNA-binding transcriptional regulator AlpA